MSLKKHLAPILCLIGFPALAKPFVNFPSSKDAPPAAKTAASPSTLSAMAAFSAADVIGFWSKAQTLDLGISVTIQFHFEGPGSFETRIYSKYQGQESRIHGFGTWILKGESVELVMDTNRCLMDEGEGAKPCEAEDAEPWTVIIREAQGVRSLVDTSDGVELQVADYVGPQRQFTLPAISKPSALGPTARDGLTERRRGLSITVQPGSSGAGFDMTGRIISQGAAVTPRVPPNYYKLR